jgi:hypothetical protein
MFYDSFRTLQNIICYIVIQFSSNVLLEPLGAMLCTATGAQKNGRTNNKEPDIGAQKNRRTNNK